MYVCMYACVASTARSSMFPFLRLVFIVVRFTSQPFSISYAKNHAMIRRPDPPPPSTNAIFENNCTTPVIHKPIIPNLNLQSLVNIKLRWSHDTIVFRWLCCLSHQTIHVLSKVMLQRTNLQHNRLVENVQFDNSTCQRNSIWNLQKLTARCTWGILLFGQRISYMAHSMPHTEYRKVLAVKQNKY